MTYAIELSMPVRQVASIQSETGIQALASASRWSRVRITQGGAMPFRSIVAAPEALAAMSAAFDAAWREIEAQASIDPSAASAARERLGYIIIGLWKIDSEQDLAKAAVEQFTATPGLPVPTAVDAGALR